MTAIMMSVQTVIAVQWTSRAVPCKANESGNQVLQIIR